MAEAATVVQLVQFSGLVLSCCYEYISKAKSAPEEIQKAINEISSLKGILENLKPLAETPGDERFNLLKSLDRADGPFEACSDALKELDKKLRALTEASNVRRRLQWPLEAGKIEAVLQKLSEHKTSFILALAGDNGILNLAIDDAIGDVKSSVDEIQAQEQRNRILEWLNGSDPATNHNAAQKKKEDGTCEWLIRSKQFQAFTEGENQLMWLHGIPGAGKTVLSSAVIEFLSTNFLDGDNKVIYYYFDFNDHGKQTCFGCLQSLVRQICSQSSSAPADIVGLYAECKGATPSSEQLVETLKSLLGQDSRIFIVIDALDECKEQEEEEERAAVLDALRDIKSSATGPFNIFVASRPEADISREMSEICDIDLDVQAALVDEDIRCHVRSCLTKDARLKRWPQNVKKEIEDKLTNDANGMFRWVVCQLAELRKCLKLPNIRKALNNLPKTLDATYTRILKNIPSMYQREMRTVLMLLAFSERPMTIQEVSEATAVNLEEQKFSIEDRFPDAYDLLEFCSSLVSLSELPNDPEFQIRREGIYRYGQMPPDVRILQFAHFSVKEYILSDRTQKTIPSYLLINEALSHSYITQACLIYLLDFNNGERASRFDHEEFPFLAYAALYWTTHLSSMTEIERGSMEALLVRLFDPQNENNLMNYLNLYDPNRRSLGDDRKELSLGTLSLNKRDFQPPIYYACYHGLQPIVKYLLSGDEKTRPSKEVMGSGLAAAASAGYIDTVKLLLKEGADPNSPYCGRFWRPLHAAASSGNPTVVKLLLEAGSLINAHNGDDGGALHIAAEQGNPEVIQLLIDHGHDLYTWSRYHGPPLSYAVMRNRDEAVAALVQNKVDVNTPPDGYLNSLNLASEHAGIETIRLLLDNGANAALERSGSQALHNAAKRGDIDIMQLLIERGADVNGASDGVYGTPLKAAIQSRQQPVFELMLRKGADINARGSTTKYPIDQALFGGNQKAAERLIELGAQFGDEALERALDYSSKEYLGKMLLDRGANPNAEHRRYGNILQFAVIRSSLTAVRWLLEAGADPNDISDGEYGTPLQAAAYRGKIEVVRLLLEYGASVNPSQSSGEFGTPLQAAIRDKSEDIIHLLLDHGADVNATGGKMGTPLQAAASAGLESVVKSLVSKGADINAPPGGRYGTAIRAALAEDQEQIARFLLERKADIMVKTDAKHTTSQNSTIIETYSSALEVAAATNNPKLVQLLLDHGSDINSDGEVCSRSLMRASQMTDCTMLEFLIAKGADVKNYGGFALTQDINRYDSGRLGKIQLLLKHGANVDGDPSSNMTPLSSGIHNEQKEVIELLLNAGCDVNAIRSGTDGSALHEAIDKVDIDVVKELIRRGADVNLRAGMWGTPLTAAIMKGDEGLYRLFLDNAAEVDAKPPYGYWGTPLQVAISKGYYEMAHELLDRGADPNGAGCHASPLTTSCGWGKTGQLDMIKRLLSLGADVEAEDVHRPEDDKMLGTRFMWTPLQYAAYTGKESIVELLLEHGANINPKPLKGTYGSPLQAAAMDRNESMTKFLLKRGADVNAVGGKFGTALQAAAAEGSDSLVNLLLEAGADPLLEGGYYGSPLQAVSRLGKERHVELFLDLGAPTNTNVGKYGNPLAAAAKRAHRETVEMLIARGANVNQHGGKYGTPLQAACCATGSTAKDEQGSVVKLLLDNGADVNAKEVGKYGTALQAAAYHDRKYVEILLNHGADPNILGGKFGSALKAARKKGFIRMEKLLLEHGAKDERVQAESEAKLL